MFSFKAVKKYLVKKKDQKKVKKNGLDLTKPTQPKR